MALTRFPGFIDAHAHLRDPGATHKEDFTTGARAALKGGFTFVIDMPNNVPPTVTPARLEEKYQRARQGAKCDVGFYYGTNGANTDTFDAVGALPHVYGLKVYCNHTTGEMLIEDPPALARIFSAWRAPKPILLHAEGETMERMLALARRTDRTVHVCHISRADEVVMVRRAKQNGGRVSAGVCPHHLFLTADDRVRMKGYALMKPPLGTHSDQDALWQGIYDGTIDIVETDHAPHTREEKEKDPPPYGVPGLETAAGLMFHAVHEGRLPEDRVRDLLYANPQRIFHVPEQADTYIELDPDEEYTVGADGYETKCGWSPFEGMRAHGPVRTAVLRGRLLVKDGKIL